MSDEAAFLDALKANPADDTARLVYADWLDEHNEPLKAEYLRAVVALAQQDDNLLASPEAEHLTRAAAGLDDHWRAAAGSRFSLILTGFAEKIRAIKWVREVTGDGLAEAKDASEHLPHVLHAATTYEFATHALSLAPPQAVVRITPADTELSDDQTYDLVASCTVYTAYGRQARERAAREAREALARLHAAVGLPAPETLPLPNRELPLATGLTLQQSRALRVELRRILPLHVPGQLWSIWLGRRPSPTRKA